MEKPLKTVTEFNDLMLCTRQRRRAVTRSLLRQEPIDEEDVEEIKKARDDIRSGMASGFSQQLIMDDGNCINFNIQDELTGLEKDIVFLESARNGLDVDAFIDYLASFHPVSKVQFYAELNQLRKMLQRMLDTGGIDLFITDWDGTMKTYCCNYRTSMQPAYTAFIVTLFTQRMTMMSAVLTAGPLRDFGFLDLIAMPSESSSLKFGGSWGREWLVDGRFIVFKENFQQNGEKALKQLTDSLTVLMSKSPEFSRFFLIGSGFQRKVDRVTIGIQNVNGDIASETVTKFLNALKDKLHELDPDHAYFCVHKDKLDVEIILKGTGTANHPWNKADGVKFLLHEVQHMTPGGNVWICGDTTSDLPMVDFALSVTDRTYATFIHPTEELKSQIHGKLTPDRLCIAGCPEVLHAALLKALNKEVELTIFTSVKPRNAPTTAVADNITG